MSHFKINEHKFVTSDNEILAECEAFYTELHENVIYRLKVNSFSQKTTSQSASAQKLWKIWIWVW